MKGREKRTEVEVQMSVLDHNNIKVEMRACIHFRHLRISGAVVDHKSSGIATTSTKYETQRNYVERSTRDICQMDGTGLPSGSEGGVCFVQGIDWSRMGRSNGKEKKERKKDKRRKRRETHEDTASNKNANTQPNQRTRDK